MLRAAPSRAAGGLQGVIRAVPSISQADAASVLLVGQSGPLGRCAATENRSGFSNQL